MLFVLFSYRLECMGFGQIFHSEAVTAPLVYARSFNVSVGKQNYLNLSILYYDMNKLQCYIPKK